jgi:lipoprotein-releasing system permease protein
MSKLPFELLLALRYLRPKRTFVSIITLISITGVALGVAVLIIVISVMSGFDHELRQKILGFNAHLTVMQYDPVNDIGQPMTNYDAVAATVAKNPHVRGVTPFIAGPVLLKTGGDTNVPSMQDTPVLRGVDVAREEKVSELPHRIVFGNFDLSGHGIVVGAELARNLRLRLGDHVSIYTSREAEKIREAVERKDKDISMPLPADYEVRGIFDMGYNDFDSHYVCVSLDNAQDLYELDDAVHGLLVMVDDPDNVTDIKAGLQKDLGEHYSIATWMEQNETILSAIAVEKNVMFYLLFFIVLVAALCILNAQITFVIQKTREIGMLKALGASRLQISGIFLFQSAIIGIIGVTSGFGFGMLAVIYRNPFLHFMRHTTGIEIFPSSVYGFYNLPALIMPRDVAVICVSSFIICILGGLLPAMRAGKLKPVEALRYE